MASRQIKMPAKESSDTEVNEVVSQRKRPESGRYLLQVDRQTKGSYPTPGSGANGRAGDQEGLSHSAGVHL